MKPLADFIFRFRLPILVLIALCTLFFGYECTKLTVNSDLLSYLPKNDRAVALFNEVGDTFSGNDIAMIAVRSGEIFTKENLAAVAKLTQDIKGIDGVASVMSLTDIIDIRKAADGSAEVGKLIDPQNIPQDEAGLAQVKAYALSKEFYRDRFVSTDSKYALVMAKIAQGVNKAEVARDIKKTVLREPLPFDVYFGGNPFLMKDLSGVILSDLAYLIPLISLLIIITLYVSFKNLRGVLIPFVSVGISTVWTLGLMAFMGKPLSVISDIIPVLLIAIGTAPAIHILSKYDERPGERYGSRSGEAKAAFREVGLRVILTELTIIFGFASFIFGSYLIMIREFGLFTAIGTFFVLFVSTLCIPAYLTFLHVKSGRAGTGAAKINVMKGIMDKLGVIVVKHKWGIVAAFVLVLVVSLAGIPKIERKVDMVEYFDQKADIRVAENVLHDHFGGSRLLQVMVKGDIQSPVVLKEMDRASKFIASLDGVCNPSSVNDLVTELNNVMDDKKTVPDTRDKVSNLWFLVEGQEILPQLVNDDRSAALLQATISVRDMKGTNAIIADVDDYLASLDTAAVSLAVDDLTPAERPDAYARFCSRIADEIAWDVRRYDKSAPVDKAAIAKLLYDRAAPALKGNVIGEINAGAAAADVLKVLPESIRGNDFAAGRIKDDAAQLNDRFISVPPAYYAALSVAVQKPAEPVPFSLAQSGIHVIYKHIDDSLVSSQVESFLIALGFIYVLLVLQMGSFLGGLVGMVPIVITVLANFGLMGYTGIPMDVATVLAASVALGIGIDYSIHFTMRFRSYYTEGHPGEALQKTLETTGVAILINMVSVTLGFLTLTLSHLAPVKSFGILVAVTMIGSGIGAVTLLPALTLITGAKFVGSGARLLKAVKSMFKTKPA